MSEAREIPGRIAIAGAGQLGLLAAVALRRAFPASEVLVIATPPDPGALADRFGTALPFTNRLHDRLGIEEELLLRRCGASHRLAMHYIGWAEDKNGMRLDGYAAYGALVDPKMKTAFAREWGGGPRNAQTERPPVSVGEALARAGRFAPPDPSQVSPLSEVDYALRWNMPAYRDLLIEAAQRLGVQHIEGTPRELVFDGPANVGAVVIEGVGEVSADLYIDCSGPIARLSSAMPGYRRIDWPGSMAERRLLVGRPGAAVLALEDRVVLTPQGWLQQHAGRDGLLAMLGVAEGVQRDRAIEALGAEPEIFIRIGQCHAERSWIGNVVALGDAAAHFEPLGWLNLDLAHRQLALLLELLPGKTPDPRERDEFNRRAAMMAERVRDVLALHYHAPAARGVFGAIEPGPATALALDQFTRRGRLPFFEEMPFQGQELGHLLDALGIAAGEGAMQAGGGETPTFARLAHERQVEAALGAAPPYGAWMESVLGAQQG
jgi:tryptophan halogenase